MTRMLALLLAIAGLSLALAGPASADFTFDRIGMSLWGPAAQKLDANGNPVFATNPMTNQPYPMYEDHGPFNRQAGSHPDFTFSFAVPYDDDVVIGGEVAPGPLEAAHIVDVDLPQGLVGDPTGIATCDPLDLAGPAYGASKCPVASQVGIARVVTTGPNNETTAKVGVYNIAHGPEVPARFGFNVFGAVSMIDARLRPTDYGISSGSFAISQGEAIRSADITLWGVPADRSHDEWRQPSFTGQIPGPFDGPSPIPISTDAPRVPFLSMPTACSSAPLAFTARGDSWEHQGVFDTRTLTADGSGTPFLISGCERLPFKPTIDVQPLSRAADAPSGLTVDLKVPQVEDPDGLATAHVRRVVMTMPEGMTVSPSSAAGLGACAPAQIGLGTNAAPSCPDSAKLGKVTIDTPLLDEPLTGDILLATQKANPFNSLIALYIAVKGPGFHVKLPGRIDLDQATGQIRATFDNTPQLPFSRMLVEFSGGSQAALATPTHCGSYTTRTEITSWASDAPVALDSPMTISENCAAKAFTPSFSAGTTNVFAGQFSTFRFTLTRSDGMPFFSRIETVLPKGMLADISSVPQCAEGPAAAGTCPAASRIGTTTALSGPGGQPLGLTGSVSLTGPYKDAPFGLSIAVPTAGQAGPFDLGTVVVRAGLYVDRTDAHVTVKSDPLPTIIQGIPLRLRQVSVAIDRPKFFLNPTSCAKQSIFGGFDALGGAVSHQALAYQAGGCRELDLKHKLKFRVVGKSSTKDGRHPGVEATMTDAGGGANLSKVEAKLPLALVLEPENAQALCKPEQAAKLSCPKSSIVGSVVARSVLPHELKGPVYFVEGRRTTKGGRTVATLPDLWIPLSGDGVTIDVRAKSQVDSSDRLVTSFSALPDAIIKSLKLKINGGKHGILVVSGKSTCKRDMTLDVRYTGQNAQIRVVRVKPSVDGCKRAAKATKRPGRRPAVR